MPISYKFPIKGPSYKIWVTKQKMHPAKSKKQQKKKSSLGPLERSIVDISAHFLARLVCGGSKKSIALPASRTQKDADGQMLLWRENWNCRKCKITEDVL